MRDDHEQDSTQGNDEPQPDDPLPAAQEGKGYGEDEGEREQGLGAEE